MACALVYLALSRARFPLGDADDSFCSAKRRSARVTASVWAEFCAGFRSLGQLNQRRVNVLACRMARRQVSDSFFQIFVNRRVIT
jgi:hypothetical protein